MSFNFSFKFKRNADQMQNQIENKFDEAKENFQERLEESYGEQYVNNKMFKSGKVFQNKKTPLREGTGGRKDFIKEVGEKYVKAWNEKYKDIQESHETNTPAPKNREGLTPHLVRKKNQQGEPAPHNGRPTEYGRDEEDGNPWTIWTGLFKDKVGKAFTEEFSNEYINIANLVLAGGFRMVGEGYPYMYDTFTEWFQDNQIIQNQPFEINDTGNIQNEVGDLMASFAQIGFVEPFIDVFNNLDIKI